MKKFLIVGTGESKTRGSRPNDAFGWDLAKSLFPMTSLQYEDMWAAGNLWCVFADTTQGALEVDSTVLQYADVSHISAVHHRAVLVELMTSAAMEAVRVFDEFRETAEILRQVASKIAKSLGMKLSDLCPMCPPGRQPIGHLIAYHGVFHSAAPCEKHPSLTPEEAEKWSRWLGVDTYHGANTWLRDALLLANRDEVPHGFREKVQPGWATRAQEHAAQDVSVVAERDRLRAHLASLPAQYAPVPPPGMRPPVMGGECSACFARPPYHEATCPKRVPRSEAEKMCSACGMNPMEFCDLCAVCEEIQHRKGGGWDKRGLDRVRAALHDGDHQKFKKDQTAT